jgi:polysaccharide biosynthesis/export protein
VPSNKDIFFKTISLILIACLLAPSATLAQPATAVAPPAPSQPVPTPPGARPTVSNIAIPARRVAGPDYRLGNGDAVDVQIAGRLEVTRAQVIVDPEGLVNVPTLGAIEVGGLTLLEANRRIGERAPKETISIDLPTALIPPADVVLQTADTIFVPPLSVLQDVVEVRGAFIGNADSSKTLTAGKSTIVQRFELAQGERLRDVAVKAGGAAAYADLRLAFVDRTGATGPRQRVPIDMHRLLVEKDETQNIVLQNGDVLPLPVVDDKVYVVGEVRAPGAQDFRPALTPREYVALTGGPGNRAKVASTTVTFRNGRTCAMTEAPPLEPGTVVTVPEVAVKWWQD